MNSWSKFIVIFIIAVVFAFCATTEGSIWDDIMLDYPEFYSADRVPWLCASVLAGGIMANTDMDSEFQDWYRDDIRSGSTDDLSDIVKTFGEGRITLPVYLGAYLVGLAAPGSTFGETVGEWGGSSLRGIAVGAPLLLALQVVTGGSRPSEADGYDDGEPESGSQWDPFNDSNGVSGHSFMGAVPFLSAAHMTDNGFLKAVFYSASVLCGWSRVNDDDHYFSQAFLGWCLAYFATDAVASVNERMDHLEFGPVAFSGGVGVGFSLRF